MEKYYLTRLATARLGLELSRKFELVEISYDRKPPSFGVVYLTGEQEQLKSVESLHISSQTQASCKLALTNLDIEDTNSSHFETIKSVDVSEAALVDFDSKNVIELVANRRNKLEIDCVILYADGTLIGSNFSGDNSSSVTLIDSFGLAAISRQQVHESVRNFTHCKLSATTDQDDSGGADKSCQALVHLLAEQCYFVCQIGEENSVKLLYKYHTQDSYSAKRKFATLSTSDNNPHLAVIGLSNGTSFQVLSRGQNLLTFDTSSPSTQGLLLSTGPHDDDDLIFLSRSDRFTLDAHSLHLATPDEQLRPDPDQVLVRKTESSSKLCWSIDLSDIESIQSLIEEKESGQDKSSSRASETGTMCPMWSHMQLNPSKCWPKFLTVSFQYHLLIYSFEQVPKLPFATIYDRSFMDSQMQPPTFHPATQKDLKKQSEYIDLRERPKLLHNFKLIGAQPADSLFNTLFLASENVFTRLHYFSNLGLLIGTMNQAHLMAFRITSNRVSSQKLSLYQKQVNECICSAAILKDALVKCRDTIVTMNREINRIQQDSHSSSGLISKTSDLNHLISVKLKQSDDIGCLYTLCITMPSMLKVCRVIILSTADSYIFQPKNHPFVDVHIDNDYGGQSGPNDGPSAMIPTEPNSDQRDEKEDRSGLIKTLAIVNLSSDRNPLVNSPTVINLPIVVMDGSLGQIKTYFTIDSDGRLPLMRANMAIMSHFDDYIGREAPSEHPSVYYQVQTLIRPLNSYRVAKSMSHHLNRDNLMKLEILAGESNETICAWISECFPPDSQIDFKFTRLFSNFTHCYIELSKAESSKLIVQSDDFTSLDLLKKHVLRRATDESTKVDMNSGNLPTSQNLIQAIAKQLINLENVKSIVESTMKIFGQESSIDNENQVLFDILSNEIDIHGSNDEFAAKQIDLNDLKEMIKKDLDSKTNPAASSVNPDEPLVRVLQELFRASIVDALIDFDRISGKAKASVDAIAKMRSDLVKLNKVGNASKVAESIVMNWSKFCQQDRRN